MQILFRIFQENLFFAGNKMAADKQAHKNSTIFQKLKKD
jgi:hypothetical protein